MKVWLIEFSEKDSAYSPYHTYLVYADTYDEAKLKIIRHYPEANFFKNLTIK